MSTERADILDVSDFTPPQSSSYRFGIDRPSVVAALRKLADQIERDDAMVTKALMIGRAQTDDFVQHRLILDLAFKRSKKDDPS
jgi:hypothetical protein